MYVYSAMTFGSRDKSKGNELVFHDSRNLDGYSNLGHIIVIVTHYAPRFLGIN